MLACEREPDRCGEARADLLLRLPGIEPRDVDARDPDAVRNPLRRPGRGRERDRRAEDEQRGQRRALPERHADERGGYPFHEPDGTTKSRILREKCRGGSLAALLLPPREPVCFICGRAPGSPCCPVRASSPASGSGRSRGPLAWSEHGGCDRPSSVSRGSASGKAWCTRGLSSIPSSRCARRANATAARRRVRYTVCRSA